MAKILLIDDDQRQINWAKTLLKDHELRIKRNLLEWEGELEKELATDIVLTDLFIPFGGNSKNDSPNCDFGIRLIGDAINLLFAKKIKGAALISNFEHHAQKISRDSKNFIRGAQRLIERFGKDCFSFDYAKNHEIRGMTPQPLNILFFFDSIHISNYSYFFSPEGKIVARIDIEKNFCGNKEDIIPSLCAIRNGYLNLKPFDKIVEALLADSPVTLRRRHTKHVCDFFAEGE